MRSVSLWTSAAIAEACKGTAHGDFVADGVTFDSREVVASDLFIAFKGEATACHRFVGTARQQGAAGLLVWVAVQPATLRGASTAFLLQRSQRLRHQ